MFDRVRPGDVFLCYCKGPASRWVGALRATVNVFQSEEPVWGLTAEGEVRFPWRYTVEPVITLALSPGFPAVKSRPNSQSFDA